jgi:bile acid:Na+ symporter, BASS family
MWRGSMFNVHAVESIEKEHPMQSSVFTTVVFPFVLAFIMLGMGLSLTVNDFKRVLLYPKAVALGLLGQLIVVPLIGFLIASVFPFPSPELAVGLMIVAVCVGGSNSTLLNFLLKGDVPLSITLTALTNGITVFTIPFLVNFALRHFMGSDQVVQLNIVTAILQLILITLVPTAIGMAINARFPRAASKAERPVKIFSAVFLAIAIIGAVASTWRVLIGAFVDVGIAAAVLNISLMILGYLTGWLVRLPQNQRICMGIEFGIQNGILAVAIASSPLMLNNPTMTIPAVIYSLLMLIIGVAFGFVANYFAPREAIPVAATA